MKLELTYDEVVTLGSALAVTFGMMLAEGTVGPSLHDDIVALYQKLRDTAAANPPITEEIEASVARNEQYINELAGEARPRAVFSAQLQ